MQNDITDLLRETFNAFPLRVPETRVKPLVVMGQKGKHMDYRGEMQYLLDTEEPVAVEVRESTMADTSLQRSQSIGIGFGIKILEGFLSGFGMSPSPLSASLQGVDKISFSFTNSRRQFIDPSQLGQALRGRKVDLQHPSLGIFRGEEPFRMLLVSDAIVSNSFTVNLEKVRENEFKASLPALQAYASDAEAEIKLTTNGTRSIHFQGEEDLTFAFSCLLLEMDPQTGALAIGETVRSRGGGETESTPYAQIDEDNFEPGMVEFD